MGDSQAVNHANHWKGRGCLRALAEALRGHRVLGHHFQASGPSASSRPPRRWAAAGPPAAASTPRFSDDRRGTQRIRALWVA